MNAIPPGVFFNRDVLIFSLFPLYLFCSRFFIINFSFTFHIISLFQCFYLLSFFTYLSSFSFIRFYFHPEDPRNTSLMVAGYDSYLIAGNHSRALIQNHLGMVWTDLFIKQQKEMPGKTAYKRLEFFNISISHMVRTSTRSRPSQLLIQLVSHLKHSFVNLRVCSV